MPRFEVSPKQSPVVNLPTFCSLDARCCNYGIKSAAKLKELNYGLDKDSGITSDTAPSAKQSTRLQRRANAILCVTRTDVSR